MMNDQRKTLIIDGKHSHGNGDRSSKSSNHQVESRIGMVEKHGLDLKCV